MGKAFEEKLEAYRQLKEANPDEKLAFFADHFGVNIGTVSRWNKKLRGLSIEERIRAELEKEFEARVRAVVGELEEDREKAAAKKAEAERWKQESRHQLHARTLKECPKVDVYPSSTIDVTWQGHRYTLTGGVKNTVPEVIAGVYYESQKAGQQSAHTIARYQAGQYLGKMS